MVLSDLSAGRIFTDYNKSPEQITVFIPCVVVVFLFQCNTAYNQCFQISYCGSLPYDFKVTTEKYSYLSLLGNHYMENPKYCNSKAQEIVLSFKDKIPSCL